MTKKSPVSDVQNIYFDSAQLDETDLTLEQNYNNNFQTSLINNHVGTGVLPEVLVENILFDSSLVSGVLDGIALSAQNQPADNNLGNQLEIELSGSAAAGKKSVKVAIIGLDFQGNLQYDALTFKTNEKQITSKHYSSILLILFNDLIGQTAKSFNLGGKVIIKEAKPYSISRDPLMVSQEVEPSLFWRDFFTNSGATLQAFLTASLPLYNIDSLNINTGYLQLTPINKNDVTSQVGEKFLATTNNIQKITLLMAVQNTDPGQASILTWHGDLVVSIYPLQSSIECPTDLVPNLAIDYSPSNIPLAQISVNYNTLQDVGVTLDGTPQPVDFIFSNTLVANGNSISSGKYYAVTVKRSGSADLCDILLATGNSYSSTSRVTTFNGSLWVDLPDQELWYQVWTDAVKVSDGQAYEGGHGITIPKVKLNPLTGVQEDYSLNNIQFSGNSLYTAVVSAITEKSGTVQDQRTGQPVQSRQQFVPEVSLLNAIDIANLQAASEPLVLGLAIDKNQKSFDVSSSTLSAKLHSWNFIKNEIVIKVIEDVSDTDRYDADVNALVSNLTNGDFTGAKIYPDVSNNDSYYRICKAELVSMLYGDVNGDGIIDDDDITALNNLLGLNLNVSPPEDTVISHSDGYHTEVVNGYYVYSKPFANDSSCSFQIVDSSDEIIYTPVTDGQLVVDPSDGGKANFQNLATDFSTITNLADHRLVITSSSNDENIGSFAISGIDSSGNTTINISKIYLNSEVMMSALRADIDGDFEITSTDGYYLSEYLNKTPPFPTTALPLSKVGTSFNVIRITLDPFTYKDPPDNTLPFADRNDNFPYYVSNRSSALHTTPDIFLNDGYTGNLRENDFQTNPIDFNIVKQLTWDESLVMVASSPRFVPTVFTSQDGALPSEAHGGMKYEVFPSNPEFDPGLVNTYSPNNIILGGELVRPDGDYYKVDFEVGTVVLEIPEGMLGTEKTVDIFGDFVCEYNVTGVTRLGFPAMKFADGTLVSSAAIANNQVHFSAAVQSFSPNLDGVDDDDGYTGPIVDGKMGVSIDYSTGLLKLNFTNLYEDPVLTTLNTKVQVNVFLKKASFNNTPLIVDSDKVRNLYFS